MAGHPDDAADRSDIENRTAFLLSQHYAQNSFREVPGAFQIRINHRVPVILFHPENQRIAHNARIVNQEVNSSESIFHLLSQFGGGLSICHVALRSERAGAQGFNFSSQRVSGFCAFCVSESDISSATGELQRDRATNSASGARDYRGAAGQVLFCHSQVLFTSESAFIKPV